MKTACSTCAVLVMIGELIACSGPSREPAAPPSSPASRPGPPRAHHGDHHAHGHHHRFEDAASWSKVFDDPARDAWQKPARVVTLAEISAGMTVADVGAGTGYFEPHLAKAVGPTGQVVAVDVEPDMVAWIERRMKEGGHANVTAKLGTPSDPGLPAGAVDRILIVDTWHHVDDRVSYATKLAAALAKGGRVVIVDFTLDSPHGPPRSARLSPESVADELAKAGLATRILPSAEAELPYQYVVLGERR